MADSTIGNIAEIGAGGLFAYLIIKTVLDFLKNRKPNSNGEFVCKYLPSEDFKLFLIDWKDFRKEITREPKLSAVISELNKNILENTKVMATLSTDSKVNAEILKSLTRLVEMKNN